MKTMKKQLRIAAIAGLVLLVALFLATCDADFFGLGKDKDKVVEYTDWEYKDNPDGTASLTLWLDGTKPVPVENNYRALGFEIARRSHDYFEAVFVHDDVVARASWEIGQAAGIRGVARGQNYGNVSGTTAAYIVVGRKVGERVGTLLAAGNLTHVNGVSSDLVGPGARNVTFTVAALTTRIGYDFSLPDTDVPSSFKDPDRNTFVTAVKGTPPSVANTQADIAVFKGGATFTIFGLPGPTAATPANGDVTAATYTFKFVGFDGTNDVSPIVDPIGGLFYYGDSLDLLLDPPVADVDEIIQVMERIGLYNVMGQRYDVVEADLDTVTRVNYSGSAVGSGDPFAAAIPLEFTVKKDSGGAFAFTFQIPVYAVTNALSTNGGPYFTKWYIRPGHGTAQYLLDNGSTAGGAVLMGVGIGALDWLDIFVDGIGFTN